mmetsp:Transcript_18865/g.54559  ORF Transcript_18865/g.54559 Transcript_18865/m.54559 type:complete len:98 (-) Transcript_18865:465-758(-)
MLWHIESVKTNQEAARFQGAPRLDLRHSPEVMLDVEIIPLCCIADRMLVCTSIYAVKITRLMMSMGLCTTKIQEESSADFAGWKVWRQSVIWNKFTV